MKKLIVITALCLFLASIASSAPVPRIHEIRSPLFNIPEFALVGNTFLVKLVPPQKTTVGGVFLYGINDPSVSIPLKVEKSENQSDLTVVTARVPADTLPGLYDLAVQFSDNEIDIQPHAVKVLKTFKNEYDFVQFTDIHFNIQDIDHEDMNRIRRRLLLDINTVNPEFAIFTGDLGLEPATYDRDYVYGYEQLVGNLRVPVFMIPGNHEQYYQKIDGHDVDGASYWTATYGPSYHSFDYGNVHFIGMNDYDPDAWSQKWRTRQSHDAMFFGTVLNAAIGDKQWQWIRNDLQASGGRNLNLNCIAYAHIPIETLQGGKSIGMPREKVAGPNPDALTDTLVRNNCKTIFVGHNHVDLVKTSGSLTEQLTLAAGTSHTTGKWGFRIVHVKNGSITRTELHQIGFIDLKKPAPKIK